MNLSKTEQLKQLFEQWKIEQCNESDKSVSKTKLESKNITKKHFCEDGIINESIYEKQNIKVLFISNEANDDSYSSIDNTNSSRIQAFIDYNKNRKDEWKGKLRERTCALYKVIINNYDIPEEDVACNFAFMNLNKRGGKNQIGSHLKEYCKYYAEYIKKEIEIIDPDIIVWLGITSYNMNIHINYLGAVKIDDKVYININNKKVPILKMCHTSGAHTIPKTILPDPKFHNSHLGKLATEMKKELTRYNIVK